MTYVKVLNKAQAPDGNIIVTFQIIAPQIIQKELLRHRMFSFSVLSMRAVGSNRVNNADIFIPEDVRYNERGMQGYLKLTDEDYELFKQWYMEIETFISTAIDKCPVNIHKQHINRLIEPCRFFQAVVTTTYSKALDNFFNLRLKPDVEPSMRYLAKLMEDAYLMTKPAELKWGDWYIPIPNEGRDTLEQIQISCTRVARTSYGFYEDSRKMTYDEELTFAHNLIENKHNSPLESAAMAMPSIKLFSDGSIHRNIFRNFHGFMQYRSFVENDLFTFYLPEEIYLELIINSTGSIKEVAEIVNFKDSDWSYFNSETGWYGSYLAILKERYTNKT